MKDAWKDFLFALNAAFLFLLILLVTEMTLGGKNVKSLPMTGNAVDGRTP